MHQQEGESVEDWTIRFNEWVVASGAPPGHLPVRSRPIEFVPLPPPMTADDFLPEYSYKITPPPLPSRTREDSEEKLPPPTSTSPAPPSPTNPLWLSWYILGEHSSQEIPPRDQEPGLRRDPMPGTPGGPPGPPPLSTERASKSRRIRKPVPCECVTGNSQRGHAVHER